MRENRKRSPILAAPHNVVPLIGQAGASGITRTELGQLVELQPQLLNQLLAALIDARQIVAHREKGHTVFRSVNYATNS